MCDKINQNKYINISLVFGITIWAHGRKDEKHILKSPITL